MRRGDAGFTLVELLVSLSLLALAAGLAAHDLSADRRAVDRLEAHAEASDSIAAAQDLIRDRLERLVAVTRYDPQGAYTGVDGDAVRLDFRSQLSPSAGGAVTPMRLSLSAAGDLRLADPAAPDTEGAILHGVRTLEIGYFGADAPGRPGAWKNDWTRQSFPPELVRVRLSLRASDRRVWPELIVRPAPTVDTGCVLDPLTAGCRGRG